jgi:hypothetical protein
VSCQRSAPVVLAITRLSVSTSATPSPSRSASEIAARCGLLPVSEAAERQRSTPCAVNEATTEVAPT